MSNINQVPLNLLSELIQSPLNYTGSKYKLLPQILPFFPKQIYRGVDLFCGGASVGINLHAKEIILNDKLEQLIHLLTFFKTHSQKEIFDKINKIINTFNLSQSSKFGYNFYKCNSAKGLSFFNKENYIKLRNAYNKNKDEMMFFVLIVYAFNNQIRFNSSKEFNLPCGKRDFNQKMQEKLCIFLNALQSRNIVLQNKDFREFNIDILDSNSFVYIDPPYFLANASYNENNAWNLQDELDLLEFLEILHSKHIKFALSNVLYHKNTEHTVLKKWLDKYSKFKIHFLNFHYKNCNYQSKNAESKEVLVVNF